uniref:MADF domain-containing protein n=1 Tax=Anopheles epiroticus TaxID=199890 RepID=A0A182PFN5_9DIPT
MLEEMRYITLPAKTYRTMANTNRLPFGLDGLTQKRHFVKVDEEEFVKEIKKRPILYNTTHRDYRRITLRNDAWVEVAIAMRLSKQECKKRWRSMRDAFIKNLRNKNETERQGWIHYRLLEFMLPYLASRKKDHEAADECSQCNEHSEEIDYIEIDSDDELYDGSIAVSYVTHDGNEVYQLMHAPCKQEMPPDTMLLEDTEDEEIEHGNEEELYHPQHLQPYSPIPDSEGLQATTTTDDNESEPEAEMYEAQQQPHDYPTLPWHPELHLDESGEIDEEAEAVAEDTLPLQKRMKTDLPSASVSNVSSRAPSPVPAQQTSTVQPSPPQPPPSPQQECGGGSSKESDARLGITDPDERFLLSCAPILRRLPNKKNLLARLRIQQMLFELEYDEKYSYEGT